MGIKDCQTVEVPHEEPRLLQRELEVFDILQRFLFLDLPLALAVLLFWRRRRRERRFARRRRLPGRSRGYRHRRSLATFCEGRFRLGGGTGDGGGAIELKLPTLCSALFADLFRGHVCSSVPYIRNERGLRDVLRRTFACCFTSVDLSCKP